MPIVRPTTSPHRADEPYLRAVAGFYARLAATAQQLVDLAAPHRPVAAALPYRSAVELGGTTSTVEFTAALVKRIQQG